MLFIFIYFCVCICLIGILEKVAIFFFTIFTLFFNLIWTKFYIILFVFLYFIMQFVMMFNLFEKSIILNRFYTAIVNTCLNFFKIIFWDIIICNFILFFLIYFTFSQNYFMTHFKTFTIKKLFLILIFIYFLIIIIIITTTTTFYFIIGCS